MIIRIKHPLAIHELGHRDNQEDFLYPSADKVTESNRLFILCDGMGGHEHGEVASKTVSLALADYLHEHADANTIISDAIILAALDYAYGKLDKADDGADRKMGTTLCLLLIHRGGATLMHVGDSRIYHIRPSDNKILYQSRDHSLVYDLYQSGEISYDEMRTSSQKNILTRAMQPGADNRVKPSIVHITDIRPDDYFYICSDGMLEHMDNDELCRIICAGKTDEVKRADLITATANNQDNHSAWLIHIGDVKHDEYDNNLDNDEQTTPDNAINIKPRTKAEANDVDIVINSKNNTIKPIKEGKSSKRSKILVAILLLAVVVVVVCLFIPNHNTETINYQQPAKTTREDYQVKDGYKMGTIHRDKRIGPDAKEKFVGTKPHKKDTKANTKHKSLESENSKELDVQEKENKPQPEIKGENSTKDKEIPL